MKTSELKQIIKEEFSKILAEAKMFDDPSELISGVDTFLNDLYVNKTTNWQTTLKDIVSQETGFLNMVNKISSLSDQVKKELDILNNFDQDIMRHIQEYDEIYKKSSELSPEDDKIYDEISELDSRVNSTINQLEEYMDILKELTEHYDALYYSWRSILKYKFNI